MNENIDYFEDESCEHCGKLEAYDAAYVDPDSGTVWCVWCALSNGDITEEEAEEAHIGTVDKKRDYFEKRITEIIRNPLFSSLHKEES